MKPTMTKICFSLLACLLSGFTGHAAQTAADAYKAGDYDTAIRLWEQTRDKEGVSAELFYNLGNAYSKAGNQGGAVLNYEKALRLDPSDKQARSNLRYTENMVQIANQTLTDGKNMDPTPADPGFVDSMADRVSRVGSDTWAVMAVVMFLACVGCCAVYLFIPRVSVRKTGFFGGAAMLILCAVCLWCSVVSKRQALSSDTCVLMADEVLLRLSPDTSAKPVGTPLGAGTRLKVMETAKDADGDEWTRVYLNAEYAGWIQSSDVAVVSVAGLVG